MIVSIVACGESAKHWFNTRCDISIGVNDCVKFGHEVDWLVVVNSPLKFKGGRLQTITRSKPKRFLCHNSNWNAHFPNTELLTLKPFSGSVLKDRVYKSMTSPFVAITLAFNAGATDIILFGIDFLNHPNVKDKLLKSELKEYKRLFDSLESKGVKVWLGNDQTVLKEYLPVWVDDIDKPRYEPCYFDETYPGQPLDEQVKRIQDALDKELKRRNGN
jgi:hypothetical protein